MHNKLLSVISFFSIACIITFYILTGSILISILFGMLCPALLVAAVIGFISGGLEILHLKDPEPYKGNLKNGILQSGVALLLLAIDIVICVIVLR